MKIYFISDLHLDFGDLDIFPNNNTNNIDSINDSVESIFGCANQLQDATLVIAGDVAEWQHTNARYTAFISRVSKLFKYVILIAGNHEFYHGDIEFDVESIRNSMSYFENVYFLDDDVVILDDIVFIGSTLWSSLNSGDPQAVWKARFIMNDYKIIFNGDLILTPYDTMRFNTISKIFISNQLKKVKEYGDKKIVVVTHHAPSVQSIKGSQRIDKSDYAYYDEWFYHLEKLPLNPDLWIHGHTHNPVDYQLSDKTRVVSNPRGYTKFETMETVFDPKKFIEI